MTKQASDNYNKSNNINNQHSPETSIQRPSFQQHHDKMATIKQNLPEAAIRALNEAEQRRQQLNAHKTTDKKELGGRGGEDPARYGDWEIKGRAIDF